MCEDSKDPSGRYNNLKRTLFVRNIDRNVTESDLRKENDALIVRLENLKQGHKAESEMYR